MVDGVRDEALGYAALRLWTVARLKYIQQAHVGWVLRLGEVFRLHDWLPVIDRAAL
jgi:regulator of protease activity HflC (stomatin/prohibitin superfamily)